ncbi:hypothetical protein EML15_07290 [Corynebacterium sp. sy017]|uniref:hypothetical protein n=1 Tax=unclassified Corynebacterium TaxID=2624378 RepID=UPI001184ADEE|nr:MULTISPECIES: hypothetical protein [unclassified Corynebacterium]MBP3088947.1 hypothetical protein [Corynebacterium sp. sy017]QDZ42321.1 hypothetical protein FQV43_03450 [Corynebacterium sp. sy039]TSD91273.1 hypothetical protein ELY17_07300 [Corynebacterium sp. SY003]
MAEQASESIKVTEKHTYSGFSRGEQVMGLLWLCLGSLLSALLEIVYLGVHIAGIPAPFMILVAYFFNAVLTRTALLWTKTKALALLPLYVWVAAFCVLSICGEVSGDQLVASSLRSVVLLLCGVLGGSSPLTYKR